MQQVGTWIPIGRGSDKSELEDVVEKLENLWAERWGYRIELDDEADEGEDVYRLLVRHL